MVESSNLNRDVIYNSWNNKDCFRIGVDDHDEIEEKNERFTEDK